MPIPRLAPIIKAFVSFGLGIGVNRPIIPAYIRLTDRPPLDMRGFGPLIPRGPKQIRNFTRTIAYTWQAVQVSLKLVIISNVISLTN